MTVSKMKKTYCMNKIEQSRIKRDQHLFSVLFVRSWYVSECLIFVKMSLMVNQQTIHFHSSF